jgi:hypothetical protein
VGNHPIHAIARAVADAIHRADIRFLEYRLEVVASWPESSRKRAVMEGISLRLKASTTAET